MTENPFDRQRKAERLVSTGVTGVLRLADAVIEQIDTLWMGDADMRRYAAERLEWKLGDVEAAVAHARRRMTAKLAEGLVRDRIAALRDVTGRTPQEAAMYLAKADELERSLADE